MPVIRANGIDIFYATQGTGAPLLLIAGFACDHTIWDKVAPVLAKRYRVITFDCRGMGQTSCGEDDGFTVRQLAEDASALLAAIGVERAHVAGHSLGGMIALELRLAHPERVSSLILISSCARVDERGKAIIESWGKLPGQVDPETGVRLSLPWIYTSAFYAQPGFIDQIVKLVLANPHPPSARAILDQSRAISEFDVSGKLGEIRTPTLVMVGKEDILLPLKFTQELVRGIQGAELRVLEGTGHGLLIESSDEVAAAVLEFLSQVAASARG